MPFNEKKFFVAGVQHHSLHKVIKDIEEDEFLDLVREPENKFDPNAIRIEYFGTMLGYVPKKFSSEVSAALEIGTALECVVSKLDKDAKPWEQLSVVVRELQPEESDDYGDYGEEEDDESELDDLIDKEDED